MWRIIGRLTVLVAMVATTAVGGTASAGPSGGALPPVLIEALQIGGEYGVPADAVMVAATITAIEPFETGWMKAFPCDEEPPDTANLNYGGGEIANNLVLARLSDTGRLCVATRSLTDYVVDVAGYVPAGSPITPLPAPVRALDTRDGTGGSNPSPVPDGATVELVLADAHGIPKTATLAMFNLTAVGGPTGGRITAHPCDEAPGTTSSVNFPAGSNVANLVVSRLSDDGAVCFLAKNASDMVVDVAGYASGGITTLPTPRRVLDTRGGGARLDAESSVTVDPDLPDGATAAIYNLTAVDAPARGFATAHPCDEARPTSSNLNFNGSQAVGAGSVTKLAGDGTFCLFAKSPVNLIVDLIGYTTGAETYVPMTPKRINDTRRGWHATCERFVFDGVERNQPFLVDVIDTRTGAVQRVNAMLLLNPSGPWFARATPPLMSPDCESIWWYATTGSAGGLHRVGLDGSHDHYPQPDRASEYMGETLELALLDDRHVVISTKGVYDAKSDEWILQDPPVRFEQGRVALSNSGLVATIRESTGGSTLAVHDVRTGTELSSSEVWRAYDIDISPDGKYVVLAFSAPDSAGDFHTRVHTIFGDAVDGLRAPVQFDSTFTGNGTLLVHPNPGGFYLWELYGDVLESPADPVFREY